MVWSHWARTRPITIVITWTRDVDFDVIYRSVHTAARPFCWCHWPLLFIGLALVQCDHTIVCSILIAGEKPFQCEYCDKAYTQPHVLKSHHDAIHPALPFIKSSRKTNSNHSSQPSNYQTLLISQALPDHNETVAEVVEVVHGQSAAVQADQELTEYPSVLPVTGNVTQQYVVSVFNPL